jgi:AP-1 complex subunit gamma-1
VAIIISGHCVNLLQTTTDLLGDDGPAPVPGANSTSQTAQQPQSTQDLLQELFGNSTVDPNPTFSSIGSSRSQTDDIMSLFNTPKPSGSPINVSAPKSFQPQSPTVQSPTQLGNPPAITTKFKSYPAYQRHGLSISLTPQTSPAHPGMVNVQARFQVTSNSPAVSVNFQAAVPKVIVNCTP